jgi:type II secretory ATPase GspE/PulE/Tfp pilus assembly ATPase PilB-like protein
MGIYELLVADPQIKRLVQKRAPIADITAAAAGQHMRTLKQDGIDKIVRGLTDLSQVHTV